MFRIAVSRTLLVGGAIVAVACSSTMMDSSLATQLLSVAPRGGAVGVSTIPDIVLTFTGPMMPGMERYTALHQGGPTGPTMPMSCAWSVGHKTLTCRPDQPLAPVAAYAIHLGGGMMDAEDRPVGMGGYGMVFGFTTR